MATLIISYDCEGVWGMLDKLDSLDEDIFNSDSLKQLYTDIVKLHDDYGIPATFAFVGALIGTKNEFHTLRKRFPEAISINNWCSKLDNSKCKFSEQDIYIPELLTIVTSAKVNHEIATHGYSHVIMNSELDELSLSFELEGIKKISERTNQQFKTIIFPRNIVNYELLERADNLLGFRAPPKKFTTNSTLQRAISLLREFWPFYRSETAKLYGTKSVIPGDFFINWRNGLRKLVPIWLTILRFRNALNHACKHNGVVHIWLHPHNLLTGKNQLELLRRMLKIINEYEQNDSLEISTQNDFAAKTIKAHQRAAHLSE